MASSIRSTVYPATLLLLLCCIDIAFGQETLAPVSNAQKEMLHDAREQSELNWLSFSSLQWETRGLATSVGMQLGSELTDHSFRYLCVYRSSDDACRILTQRRLPITSGDSDNEFYVEDCLMVGNEVVKTLGVGKRVAKGKGTKYEKPRFVQNPLFLGYTGNQISLDVRSLYQFPDQRYLTAGNLRSVKKVGSYINAEWVIPSSTHNSRLLMVHDLTKSGVIVRREFGRYRKGYKVGPLYNTVTTAEYTRYDDGWLPSKITVIDYNGNNKRSQGLTETVIDVRWSVGKKQLLRQAFEASNVGKSSPFKHEFTPVPSPK